jgi:hypothetical protein
MAKQYVAKQDAAAKAGKSIGKYLEKVKPNVSASCTPAIWKKLSGFLFGLIAGQSCFLNTVAEHTPHYRKAKGSGRSLGKPAQVEKLSGWLLFPAFPRLLSSYLAHLRQELFPGKQHDARRERLQAKALSVKDRVFRKRLMLHDGTDIRKPYAREMELLCDCRDGSSSTAKKAVTGKGYLAEGCVAYWKGRLFPVLLSLYSTGEKGHKTEKEETKENLRMLQKTGLLDGFLHVFDRGYDAAAFMAWCLREGAAFLVRANLGRKVIRREEYDRRMGAADPEKIQKGKQTTQKQRDAMFYPLASLLQRMAFQKHRDAKCAWFELAWETVYLKGEGFPKHAADVLPVTLVAVRITDKAVAGIDEDLSPGRTKQGEKAKGERELYFFTTEAVAAADDAAVLFLCYLLRWKIETFFRWLKQVFGLEKVRLQSFAKIRNLLILLPIAANYLYGKFREFEIHAEQGKTLRWEAIFRKGAPKRDDDTIVAETLFWHCREHCRRKGLTENADSFARSVRELMRHDAAYQRITIDYVRLDSG